VLVNLAKAWLLTLMFAGVFGAAGWALGGPRTASLFVFCALLAATAVYAYADRALAGMLGAREYALAEDPLLRSTVDAVAAKLGVAPPKLYLIADGFPRCFVAGRGPRSSALAVSTGLLGALPPDELQAVIAHELAHVRRRDVLVQTFAVMTAVVLIESSRVWGFLQRTMLSFVLGPMAAAFVHLLLSPKRELAADRLAVAATGDWEPLAGALLRLDQAAELVQFSANPATEPLYPVNPFAKEGLAQLFDTHPLLEERLRRLRAA
jgi:heat shock protein HtpX